MSKVWSVTNAAKEDWVKKSFMRKDIHRGKTCRVVGQTIEGDSSRKSQGSFLYVTLKKKKLHLQKAWNEWSPANNCTKRYVTPLSVCIYVI